MREQIPRVQNLYLDNNLLHSWDQFFQLVTELPLLNTLTLTQNRLARFQEDDLARYATRYGRGKV